MIKMILNLYHPLAKVEAHFKLLSLKFDQSLSFVEVCEDKFKEFLQAISEKNTFDSFQKQYPQIAALKKESQAELFALEQILKESDNYASNFLLSRFFLKSREFELIRDTKNLRTLLKEAIEKYDTYEKLFLYKLGCFGYLEIPSKSTSSEVKKAYTRMKSLYDEKYKDFVNKKDLMDQLEFAYENALEFSRLN